jgi:kumamolisin
MHSRLPFLAAVAWLLALVATGALAASTPLPDRPRSIHAVTSTDRTNPHRAFIARRTLTPAETSATMEIEVALKMRNFDELRDRVARGERIAPAEIDAKYAPRVADYQAVANWLTAQGLTLAQPDRSRVAVFARGTVSQIQRALSVNFARVALEGNEYTSAISEPVLPAKLAPLLVGVNGLQPHLHARTHAILKPQTLTSTSAPYTPRQIAHAYGANSLYTSGISGSGQTIAIVIDTLPSTSDLTSFWSTYHIAQSLSNITLIQAVSGTLSPPGGEETIDTEWASSIAPGAAVRVYAATDLSFVNLDATYAQVYNDVTTNPALNIHTMSMSYGGGEQYNSLSQIETDDQYFAEIAASGVTIFASSGDGASTPGTASSSDTTGPLQVNNPASDPNVVSVGGTSLLLDPSGNASSETAWAYSGGGASIFFTRPAWQTGASFPGGTMRLVPDVACTADPSEGGELTFNGLSYTFGGTSWGAPVWAGFSALLNQVRANHGLASIGALNPYLYALGGSTNFRDITSGANALGAQSGGDYSAGAGYDEVTGLGVPQMQNLAQALLQSAPPTLTITSSQTVAPGSNATYSVTSTGTTTGYVYQWQRLPVGSGTWTSLSDGATYSGSATAALTVQGATTAMSGDQFRCGVTFATGRAAYTLASALVVDTPYTTRTVAGTLLSPGETPTTFNDPTALALDGSGNLFVADYSNNAIREISPTGSVTTPYGSLSGATGSSDGAGNSALFSTPRGLVIDPSGNLYVADTGNNTIRKIAGGVVSTYAGMVGVTGTTNATGTLAAFNYPFGLAADTAGNVYVADTGNNLIRKITPGGGVTTLAGNGTSGYLDGTGTATEFSLPTGVAVDAAGNVYVADFGNALVRRITPAGVVTTVAGQQSTQGALDGIGANALFNLPISIAVDSAGNLFIADSLVSTGVIPPSNNLLRRVSPAGVVSTLAGTAGLAGSTDGTGTVAQFNSLEAAFPATSGEIFLSDTLNQLIRAAGLAPGITTPPAGQVVVIGQPATFSAVVSGTPTLGYQWLLNGTPIPGATGASFTIPVVAAGDAGAYALTGTNSYGSATSSSAALIPITAAPTAQTTNVGLAATFSVTVPSTGGPYAFQWLFNGTPISGATGASYTIPQASSASAGSYSVTITTATGSATTTPVALTVLPELQVEPTMPEWLLLLLGALLVATAARSLTPRRA